MLEGVLREYGVADAAAATELTSTVGVGIRFVYPWLWRRPAFSAMTSKIHGFKPRKCNCVVGDRSDWNVPLTC